jgi:thiol-disulfide isomerase/thioredoxin
MMKKELLHFFATWCPSCNEMKPHLEDFKKSNPEITVRYIDLDENPEAFNEYADKYMFNSMPTDIAMVDGLLHRASKGSKTEDEILALFAPRD